MAVKLSPSSTNGGKTHERHLCNEESTKGKPHTTCAKESTLHSLMYIPVDSARLLLLSFSFEAD